MSGPAHVGPVPSVVPGSNTVVESAVVRAPLARVWHLIKLQDFAKFWSILKGSEEVVQGAAREAEVFKWTFADGSVYEVKQEEHSVSPTVRVGERERETETSGCPDTVPPPPPP